MTTSPDAPVALQAPVPAEATDRPRCVARKCRSSVPPHRRKYCDVHGPQASKLRKSELRKARREAWKAEWRRTGVRPPSPHLHGWPSREAYNAYYSAKMRDRRTRERFRIAEAARVPVQPSRAA